MGAASLIVCPLAVAEQTIAEAREIGLGVTYCTEPQTGPGIWITNYERLRNFIGQSYDAIVLDESSILKSLDGKTRTMLLREFKHIPHRLCCTATPAPNDISELGNHADFLGIVTQAEMLSMFFVHESDSSRSRGWRLKGHARDAFWKWLVSWALYVRMPSDLGFENDEFLLPPLNIDGLIVDSDYVPEGMLFNIGPPKGIQGRSAARRASIEPRVEALAQLIAEQDGHWIVWCGLNDEGRALHQSLNGASVLIEGSDTGDVRLERHRQWMSGDRRVLITKPSIFGWGMNWQHCSQVAFLGIGDSYESYYQAIRRCWRFGQTQPVNVHVVSSTAEVGVVENVRRKEQDSERLASEIIAQMRDLETAEVRHLKTEARKYEEDEASGRGWKLYMGDACERLKSLPDASVGLSVFSPPFASLYTYTASERDLGNSQGYDEFFEHLGYISSELLRVTIPARRACVHVQQLSTTKVTHGVIGLQDFRADMVRHFVNQGWIYDGEVVIDKDPQAQAIRTKAKALMFVQKNKDSAWSRPAMADYILLFRAPGESVDPVKTDVTNEEWILWARPIWYNIRESETLNAKEARSEQDERHVCPLQLETIRRCLRLWSNAGDIVLDPFAGIGSTGYEAVKLGREFVGIELKPEYWRVGQKNLREAEQFVGCDLFNQQEA
jgi:DNA modification methylase